MSSATLLLLAIAFAIFLALFGFQVVGYRLGRTKAKGQKVDVREGLGVVDGAVFALLGLMLAFQFSGAASRLGDRRGLAIKEANAIGTAYLRLDLLDPDDAQTMRKLFRQYLESRIRTKEAMPDLDAAAREYQIAEKLQQEIWSSAVAFCRKGAGPEAKMLLLPAVNELINIAAERKAVGQTHAAILIQFFLIGLSLIAAAVAGHAMSLSTPMPRFHMILFAAVIAITIYCILDMEHPRVGFIRIGIADQALYDLRESMK